MRILISVVLLCCLSVPTLAAKIAGESIPDSLDAQGTALSLNGAGVRKKWMFKVYVGALYTQAKSSNAKAIISADENQAIKLVMLRDVSGEKMSSAISEGFANVVDINDPAIKKQLADFSQTFGDEAKEGTVYDFIYIQGQGLDVLVNGKKAKQMSGLDFKKTLFSVWLGDKPAQDDLKDDMLGK